MGGSGGIFGTSKQRTAKDFKVTGDAKYGEQEVLKRLRSVSAGTQPSIGQLQMNANLDMANQQALALAASQRGASNPMLAFRQAQLANQQMGLEGAQQAAIMGQQEQMQANQMILGQAAAQRGVSLNSALANQQSDNTKRQTDMNMISGLGQSAASMAMLSDKDEKKNIEPKKNTLDEMKAFVESIKPFTYEYSDAKNGGGEKVGVMAQDLEKTPVGKTMVDTSPDGKKTVDVNKGLGAVMAAMADMAKRLEKLEK